MTRQVGLSSMMNRIPHSGECGRVESHPWCPPRAGRSEQEGEERGAGWDLLDGERAGLHALEEAGEVRRRLELDADQRGTGLAVVLLDVLEQDDVVARAEHLVEEVAQGAGLLRERDEEVVAQALVEQGALDDLAV